MGSLQLKMLRLTLVLVLIACVGQIIGVPLNQAHQNELKAFKAMLEKSEKAKKTEGTNESRVGPGGEPPKFMSVEGWKDCMESKDMGSWMHGAFPPKSPNPINAWKNHGRNFRKWKERSRVVAQEMTLEMALRQSPIGKVVETTWTQHLGKVLLRHLP